MHVGAAHRVARQAPSSWQTRSSVLFEDRQKPPQNIDRGAALGTIRSYSGFAKVRGIRSKCDRSAAPANRIFRREGQFTEGSKPDRSQG